MKKKLSLALFGLFTASTLQAATLIQYDFDTRIDAQNYTDVSGNGHSLKYNRNLTVKNNNPFQLTHPELNNINRSASNSTKTAATAGSATTKAANINLAATGEFTMEGWVYVEGIANYGSPTPSDRSGVLWTLGSTEGGLSSSFSLRYTPEGLVQGTFNAFSQPEGARTFNTDFTLEFNTWTHLAYVKVGSAVEIYVNGALAGRFLVSGITSRPLPTYLTSIAVASDIVGQFDDFRLSDTALSPDQLGYHTPFSIPEPSTVTLTLVTLLGASFILRKRRHTA